MSFIRKVFWPAAIALGFLVFLGAVGSGNVIRTASADDGDICEIEGPKIIQEGKTYFYVAWLDEDTDHSYTVSIDNIAGQAQITSVVEEEESEDKDKDKKDNNGENDDDIQYQKLRGTNLIHDVASIDAFDVNNDFLDKLAAVDENFKLRFDVCQERSTLASIQRILNDLKLIGTDVITGDIDGDELLAAANAILADLNAGETDCQDIGQNAAKAAIGAGATAAESQDVQKAVQEVCENDFVLDEDLCEELATQGGKKGGSQDTESTLSQSEEHECAKQDDAFLDAAVIVDVTCLSAGQFDITFADESEDDDSLSLKVLCQGPPDDATIAANPNLVEIVPALGNVSHSLITVTLLAGDDPAGPGSEVDFTVDRCSIETSGVDTAAEYTAARALFVTQLNAAVPASAAAVESSAAATAAVDATRQADTTVSFVATIGGEDRTIAAAILGCSPADTGATVATPGVATVTAIIAVEDGQDIVRTVTVTVIGPPHTLTVAATPSTLRCGEKATITATVRDSIGQNVSPHTRVEAVTNAGGVLGGTGAVAGLAGPVVPISSTVAETFNGVATFFLLTSEQHSGPYEVVVTTGGSGAVTQSLGGVFSTPPLSAQATVTCTLPQVAAPAVPGAPPPAMTAPRTGQGISPPRTGDAGLVGTTGSSWVLFAAVGAVAFAVAGLASLKFARKS